MMKKTMIYFIIVLIIFSFLGCSKKTNTENKSQIVTVEKEEKINKKEANKEETNKVNKEESNKEIKEIKEIKENKKTETQSTDKKSKIKNKKVVIDPGHAAGGNKEMEKLSPDSTVMKVKDPGGAEGVNSKTPEYVVNMAVALKLKAQLEKNNIEVIMTKTDKNQNPGNIDRAEVGNKNNVNLVIRLHCDSAGNSTAKGASILVPASVGYAKNIKDVSGKYGRVILDELANTVGMNNRGISERNDLTGFNWSKVPVVLVEMGFMSNPEEDKLLNDYSYQDKLALGLCKGIIKALN